MFDDAIIRFIPARAGNTTAQAGSSSRPTVHPRACGEHAAGDEALEQQCGSSPRVRGTHCQGRRQGMGRRFIPARAGNTTLTSVRRVVTSVHPRACGEHTVVAVQLSHPGGSSPRVRGTLQRRRPRAQHLRFIPARAGNTAAPTCRPRFTTVHPRACGEHISSQGGSSSSIGSSPRVRGTLFLQIADFTMEISLPLRYRSW